MHAPGPAAASRFPGVWGSVGLLALLLLVDLALHLAFAASGLLGRDRLLLLVAGMTISNAVVIGGFLARRGLRLAEVLHPAPASATATVGVLALPLLLIAPAIFLAGCAIDDVVRFFFPLTEQQRRWFEEILGGGALSFLMVVVLAPLFEELLFRGIVLRGLLERMPPWRAIVVSSIIFGAAHFNVYQFVGAGLIGLLLGWLYWRFRSTLPCMLVHAAGNALTFTAASVASIDLPATEIPAWIWFVSAVALVPGIASLRRLFA